jgi:hypothetical protein
MMNDLAVIDVTMIEQKPFLFFDWSFKTRWIKHGRIDGLLGIKKQAIMVLIAER